MPLTTMTLGAWLPKPGKLFDLKAGEGRALGWAWLYVFSLFLAYYVLRPIRDEMGVAGGVRNLPWLFTGTLIAMLAVNPLFAYSVKRWSRERFVAIAYRFFMMNLVVFTLLLRFLPPDHLVWVGRAFFIWVSVFNLFVVSVFWSFVVDIFDAGQGRRLFGLLSAGATMGGIAGSAITALLVEMLGQAWLLLISAILLELAVFGSRRLALASETLPTAATRSEPDMPVGGGIFAGMTHVVRSPYLMGIAAFILFYSVTSTFLYFEQATIADANFSGRAERTAFFANIDLWVNILTLVCQLFLTGRIIGLIGVPLALCSLPLLSTVGFGFLAAWPTIGLFVAFQVARSVSNYGLARPVRELLFTIVPREDRYKAKNFIDTVVYRAGDQIASWSYAGLAAIGLTITGISIVAVPLSLLWCALSLWLGGRQRAHGKSRGSDADRPVGQEYA